MILYRWSRAYQVENGKREVKLYAEDDVKPLEDFRNSSEFFRHVLSRFLRQ